jgi:hypothetical protein
MRGGSHVRKSRSLEVDINWVRVRLSKVRAKVNQKREWYDQRQNSDIVRVC